MQYDNSPFKQLITDGGLTRSAFRMPRAAKSHSPGKKNNFVRAIIHEVAGYAPYERRAMDLLKLERRRQARVFLKKRLGTHQRAMKKLTHLEDVIQNSSQ